MNLKPVAATVVCLLIAALVGYFVAGHYAIMTFIGLDPSAFPFGGLFQAVGEVLMPSLDVTVAGVILLVDVILLVAIVSFFYVRASSRANKPVDEESRRSFLAGSLAGAAGAAGALVAGHCAEGVGASSWPDGCRALAGRSSAGASLRLGRSEWYVRAGLRAGVCPKGARWPRLCRCG